MMVIMQRVGGKHRTRAKPGHQLRLEKSVIFGVVDYFWHFTDVHFDPTYWTTHESCNVNFTDATMPPFGSYECDSSWQLVESSVKAMKRLGPTPAFIVWTGYVPVFPQHVHIYHQNHCV